MNHLPTNTLRDLALIVVLIADIAWDGTKRAIERLRPHVEPPGDLEIRSIIGGVYSGVLLVDRNEIIAGVVVRVGHRAPSSSDSSDLHRASASLSSSSSSSWRTPMVTPRPALRDEEDETEGKLPGWSEDSRDREYDPWRR